MLLSTPEYKEGDVISLKNVAGEEFVCTFKREDNDTITIEKPFVLGMGPQGMGLMSPVVSGKLSDTITINKDTLLWPVAITADEIRDVYLQQTTGIAIASAGSVPTA